MLPYKLIVLSIIIDDDGERINVAVHGGLIVSILEAMESLPFPYSELEDCLFLSDVIKSYHQESQSQLQLLPDETLDESFLPKSSPATWLDFYDDHVEGSIRFLEGTSQVTGKRILRGILHLNELPRSILNMLLMLNTNG